MVIQGIDIQSSIGRAVPGDGSLGEGCPSSTDIAAVAFGHPIGIEDIQGPASGLVVELCRGHAGRNELVGGLILEESGAQVEGLIDPPQAIEHHGFDGFTHGEGAHCRGLLGRVIAELAHAECVEHASNKAAVVYDWATIRGLSGHHHRLCW
jgi:hypothetical protein